ncbi:MAG: hypothetical protein WBA10_10525 [Elainellaceae cyanobacterium]
MAMSDVMTHFNWFQHLQACPLILAGPMLRHTAFQTVAVWVALKRPCTVELTIYTTADRGRRLGEPQMAGQADTVQVGQWLHIAVVTAQPLITSLQSDRLYAYDLRFAPQDGHPPQSLRQALGPGQPISYFGHQRPTFSLPPSQLEHLQIVHGSCRKAHGEGHDALPTLDRLMEQAAPSPYHRPHQLFHTGDQIYGDDVADPMLAMCTPLGNTLLGWTETLPVETRSNNSAPNVPQGEFQQASAATHCAPGDMAPGERAEIATRTAGFTGGLREKRPRVTSHLFSLGEFCALYLLMWSPSCWPAQLPLPPNTIDKRSRRYWDQTAQSLQRFRYTLWRVRRALANVPNYMTFDDHDVSDDWNLNKAWCLRVLGKPLGRRTVHNALHSYALFQGWGNHPERFKAGQPAHNLLTATEAWTRSKGSDTTAHGAIARYLGMPTYDPETGLPEFTPVGNGLLCLARDSEAISWHGVVRSHNHVVILLDVRLWRAFPADDSPIAPPQLLSPIAFKQQLREPLSDCAASKVTFVVAPTNVFHVEIVDWIHHWKLKNKRVFNADVGDAWTINMEALATLLTTLFEHRRQVVILSGDIHYSSSIRLTYNSAAGTRVLAQLTCSSLKNEETQTRLVQSRLKSWILPERDRHWLGWNNPKTMVEVKPRSLRWKLKKLFKGDRKSNPPTDWSCDLEWLPRAQLHQVTSPVDGLIAPGSTAIERQQQQPLRNWTDRLRQLWLELLRAPWFQNGSEVVGVNNIGIIQIAGGDGDDGDCPLAISHNLYWFSTWRPQVLLCSRYVVELPPCTQDDAAALPPDAASAARL